MEPTNVLELELEALDTHLGSGEAIAGSEDLECWIDDEGGISFGHAEAVYCLRSGAAWRVKILENAKAELTCWRYGNRLRTATLKSEPPDEDGTVRLH